MDVGFKSKKKQGFFSLYKERSNVKIVQRKGITFGVVTCFMSLIYVTLWLFCMLSCGLYAIKYYNISQSFYVNNLKAKEMWQLAKENRKPTSIFFKLPAHCGDNTHASNNHSKQRRLADSSYILYIIWIFLCVRFAFLDKKSMFAVHSIIP